MANILVVDDTVMTQRLLGIMLARNNHTMITAANGQEALQRLRDNAVDLIITDINMPQMDGFALIKEVQASNRLKELPIIVMTANVQEQLRIANCGLDINPVLTHPITSRELSHAVTGCLQKPICAD